MKQCPNSNCIIYTRLDELPDTYTRCPQCGTPLVESVNPSASGRLNSSFLADEATSPYRPAAGPALAGSSVVYEDYEDDSGEEPELYTDESMGGQAVAQPRPTIPLRAVLVVVGVLAFLLACAVLSVSLGGRLFGGASLPTAAATETAVAGLHPPVNTPIALLPTLSVAGSGEQLPPLNSGQPDGGAVSQVTPVVPGPTPVSPGSVASSAPVEDALMCVQLDKGQPVGTTDAYKPADAFNLAVKATYGPGGVGSILTRWYGPDGKQIYEMKQSYTQPGNYFAGFTLTKTAPWLPGDYRVDIYTNNAPQPERAVQFTVLP